MAGVTLDVGDGGHSGEAHREDGHRVDIAGMLHGSVERDSVVLDRLSSATLNASGEISSLARQLEELVRLFGTDAQPEAEVAADEITAALAQPVANADESPHWRHEGANASEQQCGGVRLIDDANTIATY